MSLFFVLKLLFVLFLVSFATESRTPTLRVEPDFPGVVCGLVENFPGISSNISFLSLL